MRPSSSVTVTVGDGVVTLKRSGQSTLITANILGVENGEDGSPNRIWLDRLVHFPKENSFDGWRVSGAVVTELQRAL